MAGEDKTEAASGKKLSEAHRKGQIAKSRDLTSVCVLLTGGLAIYQSRNIILSNFRQILEYVWSQDSFTRPGIFASSGFFIHVMLGLLVMVGPVILTVLATSVILNVVQMQGLLFSFEAMKISFGNINPLSGFKRMFSARSLVELVKSILKMSIVSFAVYSVLWPRRGAFLELSSRDTVDFLSFTGTLGLKLLYRVTGYMLVVSCLDYFYQRWQIKKDLKMTKQEVKEEAKQSEGNPQVKAKIRSLQRAMARQRMLGKVPKASVIITNPTHFAVALRYEPGMQAPLVVAKGADFLAKKIIETGRKHRVSIVQNPPLARALYKQVRLDETIPVELYRAVAKILAFLYQQKQRNQNG
ncbi:MAG: flagellar biosynthesis protein FlhB [Syntrophobacteraceae bacterium]|nr:flagellar biosynthesis protein FlhB [Syntrophobacteraceae bacterium]